MAKQNKKAKKSERTEFGSEMTKKAENKMEDCKR